MIKSPFETHPGEPASIPEVHNPSGFELPVRKELLKKLATVVEREEKIRLHLLEVVYVDEDEIVRLNMEYLGRDYVTDIITFRYDEDESRQSIEGTLYCCASRISGQSDELETGRSQEFYRVFIHGLLHLAGYNDQTETQRETMTGLENHYLSYVK